MIKVKSQKFSDAIKSIEDREIVLPDQYYNSTIKLHRETAFSVAGIYSHDQLQHIRDSLDRAHKAGETFASWKKRVLEDKSIKLSDARLDNVFRTNIQNAYNRGRWQKFTENSGSRPFLQYDAKNDDRVRETHKSMDGIIRPVGHKFWIKHAPSNGFRCRCKLISLSESQAKRLSAGKNKGLNKSQTADMTPDKGWDYNPGEAGRTKMLSVIRQRKKTRMRDIIISAIISFFSFISKEDDNDKI